ncbi:MAG: threonine/serine exporter family protein [Fuerstiella sp.]
MSSSYPAATPQPETHVFLLRTAELLHRYGTPSYRLEGVMGKVADSLNVPSVFLYTPTALVVALGSGAQERTYLRRVDSGDIDISKVLAFDAALEDLESGQISISEAAARLESAAHAPAAFNLPVSLLAAAIACAGVAVIFGGNIFDTLVAGLFGCVIAYVTTLYQRSFAQRGWLEPVLGFTAAIAAVVIGQWLPVNDKLVTLAALILPIPGLTLTIALTELATGHLSSGSARLAGATVTLFTLVVGVAIAWRLSSVWIQPVQPTLDALPGWCLWIAVTLTPIAFAVVFKAPMSQWPAIMLVVVSGFVAGRLFGTLAGTEVGAFVGALVVGCGSNVYARLLNRPAMVPQTPGLMILVPGSIGYKSLTAMVESDTIRGVELAFSMSIVGVAVVGGLLLANQIISPKRSL